MSDLRFEFTQQRDLDIVLHMENDMQNSAFISSNTFEEHVDMIQNEDSQHLLIKDINNDIVGYILLAGIKGQNIELRRIVIQKKGLGYGKKAIKQIKPYCFNRLNGKRLWLDVYESNKRAIHIYSSAGFKLDNNDSIEADQKSGNLLIMHLLKDDYNTQKV